MKRIIIVVLVVILLVGGAAAASIFLARAHLFPAFMRKTGMLAVLSFLPLALLIFWMIRVRLVNAVKERRQARARLVHSPA